MLNKIKLKNKQIGGANKWHTSVTNTHPAGGPWLDMEATVKAHMLSDVKISIMNVNKKSKIKSWKAAFLVLWFFLGGGGVLCN